MAIFGNKKQDPSTKLGARKKEKTKRSAHARTSPYGLAHEIIRAPWFSEKSLIITEKGVYTFAVPARATKAEIAGAVKEVYKVSPKKIRIVNLPGKKKALRTRRGFGTRSARRKAYVYLNKGETIQFT